MKKLLCILAAFAALTACIFAQEKVRIDVVAGDSISTNLYTTSNSTNFALRVGLNDNKIGIIAGGLVREAFATENLVHDSDGFPMDFYCNANPYIGVELWNVEILGGIGFAGDYEITPYASVCYNLDLIKPTEGFSDRLSLKMGMEYYVDQFHGKYGPYKDSEYPGLNEAGVNLMSIFIPKLTVGLQYSVGWGF